MNAIRQLAKKMLPRSSRRWLRERIEDVPYRLRDLVPDLREQLIGSRGGVPLPPASLRRSVGLNSSREGFLAAGLGVSRSIVDAFERVRRADTQYLRWLDFGCGSGRVARFLIEAGVGQISGVDVDRSAVRWARRNLKGREFVATQTRPPLPFSAGSFDVAYSVSVFTHLDEEMQFDWLRELHRILRPRGLLLASTHHPDLQWTRPDLTQEQRTQLAEGGFLFAPGRGLFNHNSTFHTLRYLEQAWGNLFELKWHGWHGLNGYQDLSVWESKESD